MRPLFRMTLPLAFLAASAAAVAAQGMPTTQPGILNIFIEEVKVGMNADHRANELGWPAAFARAGSEDYYLAMVSMSGPNEVWYVSPYDSHAQEAAFMERNESDPALSAELARLWRADAEYLDDTRQVRAVARPDLSHGGFPDLAMARFWDITMFRIRAGQEGAFQEAVEAYVAAAERAGVDMSFRTYQVTAGMPWGYCMMFSSVNSYAEFDDTMAQEEMVMGAITPDEMTLMENFMSNAIQLSITNRFRLDPGMSFVAPETRAAAPDFWGPGM